MGERETSVRRQRHAYEQDAGVPLPVDVVLRHQCNIPICVRPDLLLPGSQRENMLDRAFDGRDANGASWRWRGIPAPISPPVPAPYATRP